MKRLALAFPLVLGACSAPWGATPVPAPLTGPAPVRAFYDGWTGEAVQAEVRPAEAVAGRTMTALARGYLPRELRWDGGPIHLWPQPEEYVRALIYCEAALGGRLGRWETRALQITATPELLADAEVRALLEEAAAEAAAATGLEVTVAASGPVHLHVDPADAYFEANRSAAYTRRTHRGYAITEAAVVFRDRDDLTGAARRGQSNTLLHEVGHVLGLGHSYDPADVMKTGERTQDRRFSLNERIALGMMYRHRRSGNVAPDRALEVAGAATAVTRVLIVD